MAKKLYSVSINWNSETNGIGALETALNNLGVEWIRLSGVQYFVWTEKTRATLRTSIAPLLGSRAYFIIVSVEPIEANGVAPQWLWDWLNTKMTQQLNEGFKHG